MDVSPPWLEPPTGGVTLYTYGAKCVDRIATQSMSEICNLWRLIVVDCDYAESYGWFLSGEMLTRVTRYI